jgi:hypothetical protein
MSGFGAQAHCPIEVDVPSIYRVLPLRHDGQNTFRIYRSTMSSVFGKNISLSEIRKT